MASPGILPLAGGCGYGNGEAKLEFAGYGEVEVVSLVLTNGFLVC